MLVNVMFTSYGEFLELITGHECKLTFLDGEIIYIDPKDTVKPDTFNKKIYTVEILDKKTINIADKAKEIIYGDREQTYGDPGKNIETIANLWGDYLGVPVTQGDVCNMMCLLKIARLKNTPGHEDSMMDLIGYTLLQERIINNC